MKVVVRTVVGVLVSDDLAYEDALEEAGSVEALREKYEQMEDIIAHVGELDKFSMTIDGIEHNLNPRNIVYMAILDPFEFDSMIHVVDLKRGPHEHIAFERCGNEITIVMHKGMDTRFYTYKHPDNEAAAKAVEDHVIFAVLRGFYMIRNETFDATE